MNGLAGRRIALIGGAGFVGHHAALRLKALGGEVFVIDSLAVNNYFSLKRQSGTEPHAALYLKFVQQRLDLLADHGVALIKADARNYARLCRILTDIDVDTIVHLAAVSHAGRSNKDPYSTFDHSLRTLENALDNARSRSLSINHFIYLSSSMVYGHFSNGLVTEESPCRPLGIYGALKYAGEKLVVAYHQVFDQDYTIIRPSALYGERCISRRVGQVFIENALQDADITVNGDGSERLDFTYIGDLLDGLVSVLVNPAARNQIFNLTFGQSRSIEELVESLKRRFPEVTTLCRPRDALTPQRGTLSIEKARRVLGYSPCFPLERGIEEYVKWYESNWPAWCAALQQPVLR